jgi:L-ascorbate metabolism protein UlaG (beta-lactamase superfamily)
MTTIRRLAGSCVVVTTGAGTTLFDPGYPCFEPGVVDLDSIGEVNRVLITHEHADHVDPRFVRWLIDHNHGVVVHSNQAVATLLAPHHIEVATGTLEEVTWEDVTHEVIPTGEAPPNRSYTVSGEFTHPGDSYQPTTSAPILALPLLIPWGSTTESVTFARRLHPRWVVPIHDFYLSEEGRRWVTGIAARVLGAEGIGVLPLDWGESYSI